MQNRPGTLGEILLQQFLKPMGITKMTFAERVGITTTRLDDIIDGKRTVTLELAVRFARVLGTSPEMWLNASKGK